MVTDKMVEAAIREWELHTGVKAVPFTMAPAINAALAAAWVPCDEREPDMFLDVLTWDGERMDVDYLVAPDYWKHRPTGITHWMPLPGPPKE